MIDYKGLRDRHLNVFWQYDGKPHLENNITKAFINSIDLLNDDDKREMFSSIFDVDVSDGTLKVDYYLQMKPEPMKVLSFPIENRVMFAFSPTGKCWGFTGQDTKDEKSLYEAIRKELSQNIKDDETLKTETWKAVDEFLQYKRGDSIPDAWILIYVDDKPSYIIALENKLYNLDPTQINNHIEKSLLITDNKRPVIYRKYDDIVDCFEKFNCFVTNQFIEYLTILGYREVDDFSIACSSDEEIRQRLSIPFGKKILEKIDGNEIDNRSWNTVRRHVSYSYLREINLIFSSNDIRVSLAFGPTPYCGKRMMESIDSIDVSSDHLVTFRQTFHLMYYRGRIIHSSYIDTDYSVNDYIAYWKKNIEYIRKYTPEEAIFLYEKMLEDGFIKKDNYDALKRQLNGKKNPVLVIPEIIVEYGFSYEEASTLGIDAFAAELKKKINDTLTSFKLK